MQERVEQRMKMRQGSAPRRRRANHYRIPVGVAQSELLIKKSVFVGTVGHAPDVMAARAFIGQVRKKYADANHNAWAFKIDQDPQALVGSSGDGEPGGTAGLPMLSVLKGSGLCEVVAVVTRYFGGIKLGTGGLVRAYSGAVREALADLPTAERLLHHVGQITIDYGVYGNLKYLFPKHGVKVEDESFADKVTLRMAVPYDRTDEVAALLRDLTNGQVVLDENRLEDRYYTRPDQR